MMRYAKQRQKEEAAAEAEAKAQLEEEAEVEAAQQSREDAGASSITSASTSFGTLHRPRACADMLEVIGHTPTVELRRYCERRFGEGLIVLKLEYLNPGHSKKDRVAKGILERATINGELLPNQPVVELTSGNTGTGLAIACAILGHPFVAVMSKGNSSERARMMTALGAEVLMIDQAPGSLVGQVSGADLALVEEATVKEVARRGAFRAHQFQHIGGFLAHAEGTGPELIGQMEDSGRQLGAFCDFIGSGGVFGGVGAALKEYDPSIACYVVEPVDAAVLAAAAGHEHPTGHGGHKIQGGGYSMQELPYLKAYHDRGHAVDGYLTVSNEECVQVARELAREEGVFAGFSTAANVCAAGKLLRLPKHEGQTIAVLACDSGLKYLSTDLWPGANHPLV
jgi:cysteine synthase A